MVECSSSKIDSTLNIDSQYYNKLDIESFSKMMKSPSYCYKFYWLEAIVILISEGIQETTFDAIIDEMIANAWYTVREFHIHLSGMQAGEVRDGLERAVLKLSEESELPANASKTEIKNAIREHSTELKQFKEQLTNMVPYRALSEFFRRSSFSVNWDSAQRMVEYIRQYDKDIQPLPYTLGASSKLAKEVYFNDAWREMIQDNTVSILGWIQYEKVKWLQLNNPEVPGLVYKLAPLNEKQRNLKRVRNLWDGVMGIIPVCDVFTGGLLAESAYEVDHFIPWSFVMSDELWNLMPMDSSLNSSKSNQLPHWDPFFKRFAENQFLLYELIHGNIYIHSLFESCYRDNLHSIWASQELYRPGNNREAFLGILQKNMQPVYDSARRQGYEEWSYSV